MLADPKWPTDGDVRVADIVAQIPKPRAMLHAEQVYAETAARNTAAMASFHAALEARSKGGGETVLQAAIDALDAAALAKRAAMDALRAARPAWREAIRAACQNECRARQARLAAAVDALRDDAAWLYDLDRELYLRGGSAPYAVDNELNVLAALAAKRR